MLPATRPPTIINLFGFTAFVHTNDLNSRACTARSQLFDRRVSATKFGTKDQHLSRYPADRNRCTLGFGDSRSEAAG